MSKTKLLNVRVSLELYKKIKATGKPIAYFVRKALEQMVVEEKKK